MKIKLLIVTAILLSGSLSFAQAPISVSITTPLENTLFTKGNNVAFAGSATEATGIILTGDQLTWRSNKDGPIGSSETTSEPLSKGTHIITLTATDSSGNSATTQITVDVQ